MRFITVCLFALLAMVSVIACGTGAGVSAYSAGNTGFGQVGVNVHAPLKSVSKHADGHGGFTPDIVIPGGELLDSVDWTFSDGTNTYSGTADITNNTAMGNWIIAPVAAGSPYAITITGTTTDGLVTCSNVGYPATLGSWTVIADQSLGLDINLVCTAALTEAGAVAVTVQATSCPLVNYLVAATNISAGTSTTAYVNAANPGNNGVSYNWSVNQGSCTLSNQVNPDTDDSQITVTDNVANDTCVVQVQLDNTTGNSNIDCLSMGGFADSTAIVTINVN